MVIGTVGSGTLGSSTLEDGTGRGAIDDIWTGGGGNVVILEYVEADGG